jgi:hypothetical protein
MTEKEVANKFLNKWIILIKKLHTEQEEQPPQTKFNTSSSDELSWKAISNSIKNHPELKFENSNVISTIINNLYKAINIDNDINNIKTDSAFAILNEASSSLPEDVIGWFFSEDQIENLASQVESAIISEKNGEELSDLQKTFVTLGSISDSVKIIIQELTSDSSLIEELIDVANNG